MGAGPFLKRYVKVSEHLFAERLGSKWDDGMEHQLPQAMRDAFAKGTWRSPGKGVLKGLFSCVSDLPDLELFEDFATMRSVGQQIDTGAYVEDAEFCMVRAECDLGDSDDTRLVFENALFIGGSSVPGDDVFIALDVTEDSDPFVLVFDWNKPVPSRWEPVFRASRLISRLE